MRKIIILLFLLFFCRNVEASWINYDHNPVLSSGPSSWDKFDVSSPTIIYDNNSYKMIYQGSNGYNWSFGLAESFDGKNWTKFASYPIMTPNNETNLIETDITEPTILKNDYYRIWFTSYNINDRIYKIRYATSISGINWQKNLQPVVIGEKDWEKKGVANPTVIFKDNKYYMWYIGWGFNSPWQIGLAESTDGLNWIKYNNNPLILPSLGHVSAPDVSYIDGKYHMFYHTGQGTPTEIYYVTSDDGKNWHCENSCSVTKSSGVGFDSQMMGAPTLSVINNQWYLFYGGFNGNNWQIGLTMKEAPLPTPQLNKTPLVIIPGFMASWNKDAILHNTTITPDSWQMAPFVHDYDGIISTLKNLGYAENQDFLVYPYDWRKTLDEDASNLNNFLQQKIWQSKPDTKVDIVGHSLGGLIGRIFTQKYGQDKVNKLVTVASPHRGTAQVYKAVEAGEIDKSNNWLWLTEKMILILNKSIVETDKNTINNRLPVLKDLLPTTDYLRQNNTFIPIGLMQIKNDYLTTANGNLSPILPKLSTVAGRSDNTLAGYNIGTRTALDKLLNLYIDGRPTAPFYNIGDYLVLATSAGIGDSIKILSLDHGELIQKKDGQKEILTLLQIPYQNNQITEGGQTIITPSLIFLIKSPATMDVVYNNQHYPEQNGIVYIPNAATGDYQLNIKGQNKGIYQVLIGEISTTGDQWDTIRGEITQFPPTSQIDTYSIIYNREKTFRNFIDTGNRASLIKDMITELKILNQPPNDNLVQAINKLSDYRNNNELLTVHTHIFNAIKVMDKSKWDALLAVINKFEYFYSIVAQVDNSKTKVDNLQKDITQYEKRAYKLQTLLKTTLDVLFYKLLMEKIKYAKSDFEDNNYSYSEILLRTVKELIKLIDQ